MTPEELAYLAAVLPPGLVLDGAGIPAFGDDVMPFGGFYGYIPSAAVPTTIPPGFVPLSNRRMGYQLDAAADPSPGRRLRVFALSLFGNAGTPMAQMKSDSGWTGVWAHIGTNEKTYSAFMRETLASDALAGLKRALSQLPVRAYGCATTAPEMITAIPENYVAAGGRDKELPVCLQDLANEINEDIREALDVLDNPSLYYSGVDEGIEPVRSLEDR